MPAPLLVCFVFRRQTSVILFCYAAYEFRVIVFSRNPGRRDIVFSEFNTLSMVYDDHSDNFTLPEFRSKVRSGMGRNNGRE